MSSLTETDNPFSKRQQVPAALFRDDAGTGIATAPLPRAYFRYGGWVGGDRGEGGVRRDGGVVDGVPRGCRGRETERVARARE